MRIRNLSQEDFTTLWEMDWSPLIKERDSIYLVIAVDQQQTSLVAEDDDGNRLGVLLATRSADGGSCYINHLLVKAEVRGGGVGSALVERLKDICRSLGIRRIWFQTNERTSGFYERLGFQVDFSMFVDAVGAYLKHEKRTLPMRLDL